MKQNSGTPKPTADRVVREIRRKTRKRRQSSKEKIRIMLEGMRGDDSMNGRLNVVAELIAFKSKKKLGLNTVWEDI